MINGQLGSCDDAREVGTRGFTTLGKKGLGYFDATRPPGATLMFDRMKQHTLTNDSPISQQGAPRWKAAGAVEIIY